MVLRVKHDAHTPVCEEECESAAVVPPGAVVEIVGAYLSGGR